MRSLLLLVLLAPAWAGATPTAEAKLEAFRKCSLVSDDVLRLDCYDRTLRESPAASAERPTAAASSWVTQAAPGSAPSSFGKWDVLRDRDSVRGDSVTAMLSADSGVGVDGTRYELVARCDRGRLHVYVGWSTPLGKEADISVAFDGAEPVTLSWPVSVDGDASFVPEDPLGFLERLAAVQTLRVHATVTSTGRRLVAVFDTRGFERALPEIRAACPSAG